ncbi:RidA family protein [Pseudonocardia parietis]|uniref:Enamine deaminase RidA (YjgF/YER057c/UK114 family) n=1 Tax=Pseudonocardia parietis TaxID=570936 RepID=A0ABS4VST5_9PSEU|nr:RidA family protein [Pseudonocardia parietis]MBP2366966.1 enamine deaminase RidA (YjgF/YER057c/UK114 family) [Pseudonocardia parietis]
MSEVTGPVAAEGPPVPQGRYVAAVVEGDLVHSAGMTPRRAGRLRLTGRVGESVGVPEAAAAARLAVGNALAACRSAADAAGRVLARPVRMTVWVACTADFADQSAVADGASAVLADRFGPDLLPVRAAVGVLALPGGAPVEVELTAALTPVRPR